MAKRKPVKRTRRASASKTAAARKRVRKSAKAARKAATRRKPARRTKTGNRKKARRTAKTVRKRAARKAPVRKRAAAKKRAATKTSRKPASSPARRLQATARQKPTTARRTRSGRAPSAARKVPRLERERWTVRDDDTVTGPPSVAGADRSSPHAREPYDRLTAHGSVGPAIAGGDLDADWESAASTGDGAPGGANPTPDQTVVDEIGRAVGVQFEDGEALDVEEKVVERDRHRWELDPGSSDDFDER